jgi:hypothetical protein
MRLVRACTPQPTMAAHSLPPRARYLAEIPALAPVRMAVIQAQSITASGTPVSQSLRTSSPVM